MFDKIVKVPKLRSNLQFSDDPSVNTDFPVKRYTAVQFTQPAAAISPLSKSTRHLLVPEPDPRYYYTHRAYQETITVDRNNLKQGKFIYLEKNRPSALAGNLQIFRKQKKTVNCFQSCMLMFH